MKKICASLVVGILALCLGMAAIGADAADIVMKVGHSQPTITPRHQSFELFKKILEERSGGKIQVQIFPSGQLGNEPEMIEAVKLGALQACRAGCFDDVTPALNLYLMPFLFRDEKQVEAICYGPIGAKIAKEAEKNGIVIPATGNAGGFRHFSCNKRPMLTPDDMKGLKMRTPPLQSIIKAMEAMGANAVSIPYGETYMALKTGVADGQENPYTNITSMKFNEVQKYLTEVKYQFHPDPFYVSLKWWKTLPDETKKLITECAVEMMHENDKLVSEANRASAEICKKTMQISVLTPEQHQLFVEKMKPVYKIFLDKGCFTQADLDAVCAAGK